MKTVGMFFYSFLLRCRPPIGIADNQTSYSVSNEYLTKFKFMQFHLLDCTIPDRLRGAEAGFFAS
jgi:hypothetical protein